MGRYRNGGATIAACIRHRICGVRIMAAAGTSKSGTAITASGVAGLTATGTTGVGLAGTSNSGYGVTGTSNSTIGVKGVSNGYYGVSGTSNKSYGVVGSAGPAGKDGVFGSAAGNSGSGVFGLNSTGAAGTGVLGDAPGAKGYGVEGNGGYVGAYGSGGDTGVYGTGNNYGVYGSGGSYGLYGSGTTYGVYASTIDVDAPYVNYGGYFKGGSAVAGQSDGYDFVGYDLSGKQVFAATSKGDIIYAGSLSHVTASRAGSLVKSYAAASSAPTVEDTGSAQLVAGTAAVRLDPTYAASIDGTTPYHVFLTPDGDTRGLYVAARTPTGFIVRETQGGRATLTFDYRIVATALGQANQRMAVVKSSGFPRAPLTPETKAPPLVKPELPAPPQP